MLQKLEEEFDARNLAIIIVGSDSGSSDFALTFSHRTLFVRVTRLLVLLVANYRKWIKDIDELQSTRVTIPILSDPDCKVLSQVSYAIDKRVHSSDSVALCCAEMYLMVICCVGMYVFGTAWYASGAALARLQMAQIMSLPTVYFSLISISVCGLVCGTVLL